VIDEFAGRAGGIQGVANNAGRHALGSAIDVSPEDLLGLLDSNCVSALVVAQAAHEHLVRSRGVIVAIGSFFDKLGAAGNLAYAASKAALASINRTLAVEWARDGIAVFTRTRSSRRSGRARTSCSARPSDARSGSAAS
jgi:NAD(P)-dependent dehydrogenase (short-subunit alcohol dehydrogenase family)